MKSLNTKLNRSRKTAVATLIVAFTLSGSVAQADVGKFFQRGFKEIEKAGQQAGKSFNNAGRAVKHEFDKAGREINKAGKQVEKAFQKAGPEIARFGQQAGREMEKGLKQFGGKMQKHVAEPAAKAAYKHVKSIADEFAKEWKSIYTTNRKDVKDLQSAIQRKDKRKATEIVLRMVGNSVGLRKFIQTLDGRSYGSIIFFAGGGGAYGVGADVAMGNAFDIKSLVHLIRYGRLPTNRVMVASFISVGVNVGTSVGGGAEVGVGFDLDAPSSMDGDIAIDVGLDFKVKVGMSITVSLDPKTMSLSGVSLGVGVGGKLELSVGLTYTKVITSLNSRHLLSLANVMKTATRKPVQPARTTPGVWRHSTGRFTRVKTSRKTYWIEVNPQNKRFSFVETARTSSYVKMYDAARKVTVLLTAKKAYFLNKNRWTPLYNGSW